MAAAEPVRLALRKLWSDHVIWTREYIVAARRRHDGRRRRGRPAAAEPGRHRPAIVPYYGAGAGKQLTELLKQHILIAVDLVADAKGGDNANSPRTTRAGRTTPARSPSSSRAPTRTGPRATCSTSSRCISS